VLASQRRLTFVCPVSSRSYWHNDTSDLNARHAGKRMASQYQPGRTQLSNTGKPIFFHNAADVELFYPPIPSTAAVRRTKPGGENVRRTASINDKRFQQIAVNQETQQTQLLASWHSQHERSNKQGERRRNDKQLNEDLVVANAELKVLRRTKLKLLLEAEQQQYKRELAAKGLAILVDEP
jgi:hypothetical protein